MSLWKKIFLIIFYVWLFLFLTALFLVWRFPYRAFIQKQIEQLAARGNQKVTYKQLVLKFPNRAIFDGLIIRDLKIPAPRENKIVEFDQLELLILPYPWQRQVAVFFKANGYGGTLQGRETYGWRDNSHDLNLTLTDLYLERYPLWKNVPQLPSVTGKLSGLINWQSRGSRAMAGRARLSIAELALKGINVPGLFNELQFTKTQINVSLKEQLIQVEKIFFTGDVFELESTGKIQLAANLQNTPLDLTIKVTPIFLQKGNNAQIFSGGGNNSFVLYLRGTVRQPSLTPF